MSRLLRLCGSSTRLTPTIQLPLTPNISIVTRSYSGNPEKRKKERGGYLPLGLMTGACGLVMYLVYRLLPEAVRNGTDHPLMFYSIKTPAGLMSLYLVRFDYSKQWFLVLYDEGIIRDCKSVDEQTADWLLSINCLVELGLTSEAHVEEQDGNTKVVPDNQNVLFNSAVVVLSSQVKKQCDNQNIIELYGKMGHIDALSNATENMSDSDGKMKLILIGPGAPPICINPDSDTDSPELIAKSITERVKNSPSFSGANAE